MSDVVQRVDRYQRRHRIVGVPLAVVYKYFDDQGPYLAAILTYYAFIAIFPLLLLASSILGFFLQNDVSLQTRLLQSAMSSFPIVGTALARPEGLQGSASGVVVGIVAALYGVLGLGQAAQNALNTAWAVPRNSRLNPIVSRLRSLAVMILAGLVVLLITLLTGLVSNLDALGLDAWATWLSRLGSFTITALVLALMMRYTTSRRPSFGTSLPGAVFIALGWHLLQIGGGVYVRAVIAKASDVNAIFALVLGLLALIFVASVIAVLGVELSVVLRRRLYPRALLTPFTDAVELTEADRRAYDSYAKAQRHKGFQHVEVTFDDRIEDEPMVDPEPPLVRP